MQPQQRPTRSDEAAELKRNCDAYLQALPQLLVDKPGKWVVLEDARVVDSFDSYADALSFGYRRYGLRPFFVKEVKPLEAERERRTGFW